MTQINYAPGFEYISKFSSEDRRKLLKEMRKSYKSKEILSLLNDQYGNMEHFLEMILSEESVKTLNTWKKTARLKKKDRNKTNKT